MDIYPVNDRATPVLLSVLILIFTTFPIVMGVLPAWQGEVPHQSASANQLQLWASSVAVGLLVIAAAVSLRQVCEIRVGDDGTIILARVVGATMISARDIRRMQGNYGSDYGNPVWHMYLWYGRRRRLRFGQFPRVIEFVAAIEALNPDVTIAGIWPFPLPGGPWPGPANERAPLP